MAARDYTADGIVVHWDSSVCIHSARCVSALPEVFRPDQQPWVLAGAASVDAVAAAVDGCPSGALHHTLTKGALHHTLTKETTVSEETAAPAATSEPAPAQLTVYADGPNVLVGAVEIRTADGALVKAVNRVALCRCGHSETKPFCDGSHKRVGFTDPGPAAAV